MPLDPQTLVKHFNKFKPVEGPTGKLVADVLELPGTNEIYIEPRSGANRREVTQLAVALAKARPDAKVEYDFNAVYYPVSANDTPTDVYIRQIESTTAGSIVKLTKTEDVIMGEVSKTNRVELYDAVIDAIRLSRDNSDKTVFLAFGPFTLAVDGKSDADKLESAVPKEARVLNAPPVQPPVPRQHPPRENIGGGFKIG